MKKLDDFEAEVLMKAVEDTMKARQDREWIAESETEVVQLFKKLKREHQGEDQADIIAAFEADTLPPGHIRNTKGFEPT